MLGNSISTIHKAKNVSLDPYLVNNLRLDYNLKTKGTMKVQLQLQVNNIFNTLI